MERCLKRLEEATAEGDDGGVGYYQGRVDALIKRQKKELSPDQLKASRVKVAANSNLAECNRNESNQRDRKENREKLVLRMEHFAEKGKSLREENNQALVKAQEDHAKEVKRIDAQVLQGKQQLEEQIAEIDAKILTQAEQIRQGQTATHNVLAEAVTADAEAEEGEEEEEAQKDE